MQAQNDRHRKLTHRALPLAVIAGLALIVGVIVGSLYAPPEEKLAKRFVRDWQRGDLAGMYRLVSARVRGSVSLPDFESAYARSALTATSVRVTVGRPSNLSGHTVTVPVKVRTRIFGLVRGKIHLRFDGSGDSARIAWAPDITFPGLASGERLTRRTRLLPRANIYASDGTPLAKGADRSSPLAIAPEIVGQLGPPPAQLRPQLESLGYPAGVKVGISGLERAFNSRLSGRPGGELLAGSRVIARSRPLPGKPVKSTINPKIEQIAVNALGGRFGGITVLDPRTGGILALAGVAFSALQPPGSTFKVVTTTAALEAHKVKLSDNFPYGSYALLGGVPLHNANNEVCGGNFVSAFAQSCNSVFAPLGAKVGIKKLVQVAERYGFNHPPGIDGAMESTLPAADAPGEYPDDLAVGATSIGQGKVIATTLEMTSIAATIAELGRRPTPTLVLGRRPRFTRVTSPQIARTIRKLMIEVVRGGTGTAAAVPGIVVAGKTGTAELGNGPGGQQINGDTDGWFICFAPAKHPKLAIGVLMVRAGAGGDVAAPVAGSIISAVLKGG